MPPRLSVDQRHLRGPFDVIGDVHACLDELGDLFEALDYDIDAAGVWRSPSGRIPVFVGDLVDRGPNNVGTLDLAMRMVAADAAFVVPGNHDLQLERHLATADVPLVYGLEETVAELSAAPPEFVARVLAFLESLPSHFVFDDGRLAVAHTGLPADLHGMEDDWLRRLAAYGPDGVGMDPHDHARRHPWVATHRGPTVVYGHTPVLEAVWHRESIDIDTGCVFGWRLSAVRWPERTIVSVPARRQYARRSRPFLPSEVAAAGAHSGTTTP